jgi:hypothetical protein
MGRCWSDRQANPTRPPTAIRAFQIGSMSNTLDAILRWSQQDLDGQKL